MGPRSSDRLDAMVWALTELSQAKRVSLIGVFGADGSVNTPDPKIWG
jgi:hypothetical protein